ncbi:MAG TPA: cytochrome c oxidase subunit II [Acidimicrobiales bacterium]|nr:cytochrome c oxidase subunit II [Acidimicrobiales bacterium]
MNLLDPGGANAARIASVWWIIFGLGAAVYVVVAGFVLVAAFRGRRRRGDTEAVGRDSAFIWIGGVLVPAAILMLVAVVTVSTTRALRQPAKDPLTISVVGKRWWWAVSYPGERITTANEIHVPVGRPLRIELTTSDVIHSFWVPQLSQKVDTIPGQVNHLDMKVTKPGIYRGQCAEYCGLEHARMAFIVVAEDTTTFERWVAREQRPPGGPSAEQEARGQQVLVSSSCAGCHTVRGTPADGTLGPDLSDLGSRRMLGAGTVDNTPDNLRRWITDSQSIKPGNLMPPVPLSRDDADAVVAYLESLK